MRLGMMRSMDIRPEAIALMPNNEVAVRWSDGVEDYFSMDQLRAASPSAETAGERDIFGKKYGGEPPKDYAGTVVTRFEPVGGYATRFFFSDGHHSGLYSHQYLRRLGDHIRGVGSDS